MRPIRWLGVFLVAAALGGTACQGRTDLFRGGQGGGAVPAGGTVSLTDRDLAPVDAYIGLQNAQWVLGDDVEVTASREYFGQNLTIARMGGIVERRDDTSGGETTVTLTYRGVAGMESVEQNPRVMIGLGLTISARQRLVVHLVRTRDANRPVHLRIVARGRASRGRKDDVQQRAPELQLGGQLTRGADGAWLWTPFG